MNDSTSDNEKQAGEAEFAASTSTPGRANALKSLYESRWLRAFLKHLWQHFREDRNFESAGALSYTSLLALVPLMAVMFGVVAGFPVFDRWAEDLEAYIFANFVPTAGDTVRDYLHSFVGNSAGLTGAGMLFLLATAILLMATVEKSLNRIWRVRAQRQLSSRLVTFWAVLTLGPMLMGASLGLTSYIAALPLLAPEFVRGALQGLILQLTPFLVAMVGFALLFLIVPNRRVKLSHALIGALISAILFELAKRGFVVYVTHFPTYERIYGALATVPLFLIWIYVSWVVVLLGASVTASLTTFNYREATWRWPRRHELVLALRLLGHLWQSQRRGRALSTADLLGREQAATDEQIQRLMGHLVDAGLVHRDDDGDWLLSADLAEVPMAELYHAGPFILPVGELDRLPVDSHWDRAMIHHLQPVDQRAERLMRLPVKSLLQFTLEDAS